MEIYCIANLEGGYKALFKLIRWESNIYWVLECSVPSIWYRDLKRRNTFFFSDRTFNTTPYGYHYFEEGDLSKVE